jgi:integrase
MPLHLVAPGQRVKRGYANRFYLIRGEIAGRDVEISTKTRDKVAAEKLKDQLAARLWESRIPGAGEDVTFARAGELLAIARGYGKDDRKRLARVTGVLGKKICSQIQQADIDGAADRLYPNATNETRNRQVYTPAAAVLHYAAENKWRPDGVFKRPKLKAYETRAAAEGVAAALIEATAGRAQLLILWWFKHGTRISDTLRVEWKRIDLSQRSYDLYISKNRSWKTFPLDDEVWEILANIPAEERQGKLFPWRHRQEVYDWLIPLRELLGLTFTPHMARHRLGKDLNASGAGLKTIMGALGQRDPRSAARYAAEDLEIVRAAIGKVGKLVGKTG